MRIAITLCVFAVLAAACTADVPEATPSGPAPEPWAEFAAQHPNILLASPEATNYAPPGWPFEPGQEISQRAAWDVWAGKRWGATKHPEPVVWVVSRSGPEGALPFGPWIAKAREDEYYDPMVHFPDAMAMIAARRARGEDKYRYYGHLPVYYKSGGLYDGCCFDTGDIPAPLRGIVDPDDHAYDWGNLRVRLGVSIAGRSNPRPGYVPYLLRDEVKGICDYDDDDFLSWGRRFHEGWAQCAKKYLAHARRIHYGPEAAW